MIALLLLFLQSAALVSLSQKRDAAQLLIIYSSRFVFEQLVGLDRARESIIDSE
jgi:hypothetical protein